LEGSSFGSGSGNDDGVLHGTVVSENLDQVSDGRSLLSDSNVDAEKLLLGVTSFEVLLLVQDSIDSDGSLTGLSITNDKFSLTSTNGDQAINGLKTSLHGFVDGLSGNNTRSLDFDSLSSFSSDGAETINGVTESIEDSSQHFLTNGDINDSTSSLDDITFLDFSIVTQDDDTNVIGFQVQGHTSDTRGELDHFTGLDLGETEDSGNTITDGNNGTELLNVVQLTDLGDFLLEDDERLTKVEFLVVCLGGVEATDGEGSGIRKLDTSNTLGNEALEVLDH